MKIIENEKNMKRSLSVIFISMIFFLVLVLSLSNVSAHAYGYDPSYTNYTVKANVTYDSVSGNYTINAEFVICRKNSGMMFATGSTAGVGWCLGDATKCCGGGINQTTKECNTLGCGFAYQTTCSIFGATNPIKSCMRPCMLYPQEAVNYIQDKTSTGGGIVMVSVADHPFCQQYGVGKTNAFTLKRTFVTNSLTNNTLLSAGAEFRYSSGGDGYNGVPIYIKPIDYYTPVVVPSCPDCNASHSCSDVSQIIMNLKTPTDSLGSLWNSTGSMTTNTVCSTDAVAYFKLDGNVLDSSGNDNNGVSTGVTYSSGKVNQSGIFDGATSYIGTSFNPAYNMGNTFSIESWVKPTASGGVNGADIIGKGKATGVCTTSPYGSWVLEFTTDNRFRFSIGTTDASSNWKQITTPAVTLGSYSHVVATYDGVTAKIYVNSVLVTSSVLSKTVYYDSGGNISLGGSASCWTGNKFQGEIDEAVVYAKTLSATEVSDHYNGGSGKDLRTCTEQTTLTSNNYNWSICYNEVFGYSGNGNRVCNSTFGNKIIGLKNASGGLAEVPSDSAFANSVCYGNLTCVARDNYCAVNENMVVALKSNTDSNISDINYAPEGTVSWWRFDNGNANDYLNRNNGALRSGASIENGYIGKALNLNGSNYVEVADSSSLNLGQQYSMEAWIKPSATGAMIPILEKGPVGTNSVASRYMLYLSGNQIIAGHKESPYTTTVNANIPLDAWTHVVYTFDRSANPQARIYINGVEMNVSNNNGIANAPNAFGNGVLRIGHSTANAVANFTGMIDEVALYGKVLSDSEVKARYNLGDFTKKICCSAFVPPAVGGDLTWRNLNDGVISDTEVNDTVKLHWENATLNNVVFAVFRNSSNGRVSEDIPARIVGNDAIAYWRINDTEYKYFIADSGLLYFKVINGNGDKSNLLDVSPNSNDAPTKITINKPACGSDFNVTSTVEVEVNASDDDDLLTGTLSFGDANHFENVTNGVIVKTHQYNNAGNFKIIANVSNLRAIVKRQIVNIMVVNNTIPGDYVAACIDQPRDMSSIDSNLVYFAANSTRAIRIDSNLTRTIFNANSEKITFNWTFSDRDVSGNHFMYNKFGNENDSFSFMRRFVNADFGANNWAELKVSFLD